MTWQQTAQPWAAASTPTLPPPAWYPDPSGVAELRYWNGWAWTPGVVIRGQVFELAMPPPGTVARAQVEPDTRAVLPARAAWLALAGFVIGVTASITLNLGAKAIGLPLIVRLLAGQAGLWTGLLGACVIVSRRHGTGDLGRDYGVRLTGADFGWGALMSLAARMAVAVVVIPFLMFSRRFSGGNDKVFRVFRPDVASFVVVALIAVVGAPVVEELFFRGLVQGSFLKSLGTAGAIGLQAVLFGLAHFQPILGMANVTVIVGIAAAGVVFGITAWWRRLGASMTAHACFNLVAIIAAAFTL